MRNDISPVSPQAGETAEDAGTAEELLIEEISIDGMCGVY
jgi:mycofactocin precursor